MVEGTAAPDVETLTGNSGGAVGPDGAFNINIIGSGTINVAGNPGTNTLTISDVDPSWQSVSVNTTMVAGVGYFCIAPGGALVMTLPLIANAGTAIAISLDGATSFQVAQNAGQSIRIGNSATTVGVGGSITTTAQGNTVILTCRSASTRWVCTSFVGNFLVV